MAHIGKEKREDKDFEGYTSVYDKINAESEMERNGIETVTPPTRAQLERAGKSYTDYVKKPPKAKTPAKVSKLIIFVVLIVIIIGGIAIFGGMNSILSALSRGLPIPTISAHDTVEAKGLDMTDDEKELLSAAGYDPDKLTDKLQGFAGAFLTYSPTSLESGQWYDNVAKYVNKADVNTGNDNALQARWLDEEWAKGMSKHPSAISNLESIDDVEWYLIDDGEGNMVPFCYMTVTLTRPVLDYYALNSPACEVCRFQDSYNVYFDKYGNIYRVRRAAQSLIEGDLEGDLTKQDDKRMEEARSYKKDAIDYEAQERAEEEARKKAEEAEKKKEEEEAKKKAEEEARKAAEEDAANQAKNDDSGSGGNSNTGGTTPQPQPEPEPTPEPEPSNTGGNTGGGDAGSNSSNANAG